MYYYYYFYYTFRATNTIGWPQLEPPPSTTWLDPIGWPQRGVEACWGLGFSCILTFKVNTSLHSNSWLNCKVEERLRQGWGKVEASWGKPTRLEFRQIYSNSWPYRYEGKLLIVYLLFMTVKSHWRSLRLSHIALAEIPVTPPPHTPYTYTCVHVYVRYIYIIPVLPVFALYSAT